MLFPLNPHFRKIASAVLLTELRPHQQRVVDKLRRNSVLAAHGMGAGKTLASIGAAVELGMPVQVIAPTSLTGNYEKEVAKHVSGDLPVNVTSIGKAVRQNLAPEPGLVVLDEGHNFRNPGTSRSQYLRDPSIFGKDHRLLLLTGTPAYNQVSDIAPLLNAVHGDEVVPQDPAAFNEEYIENEKISPGLLGKLLGVAPGEVPHLKNKEKLRELFRDHVDYYETGKEGFPKREEEVIETPLSSSQHNLYRYIDERLPFWARYKVKHNLPPSKAEAKQLNSFLQGLRQISLSEAAHDKTITPEDAAARSGKLSRALDEIQRLKESDRNFRAFIYSNYMKAGLEPMRAALERKGIESEILHGGLSAKERTELVRRYNNGELPVLLGSSAAAEGLDLKGTKLVQILDPHFNNSRIEQAVGRGIRYKSHDHLPPEERRVIVQRYLSTLPKGMLSALQKRRYSVDENIASRAKSKDELAAELKQLMREATEDYDRHVS